MPDLRRICGQHRPHEAHLPEENEACQMTSAQRLQALRGIETRLVYIRNVPQEIENKKKCFSECEHLVNILITEELKDQQDADVSKIRKDGIN